MNKTLQLILIAIASLFVSASMLSYAEDSSDTMLLWGDTHLHSSYSFDAFLFQNRSIDPDTAYRYAKGYPVVHPFHKARVQIETPLDFLVVSDHAELTAIPMRIFNGDEELLNTKFGQHAAELIKQGRGSEVFSEIVVAANSGESSVTDQLTSDAIRQTPWDDIVAAAERHNSKGQFTALVGWEWSSLPDAANLHRVVMMDKGQQAASQFLPFSSTESDKPEDLWAWLETTSEQTGAEFVSIPHNMNISKGKMFPLEDSFGKPLTEEYAKLRSKWESVAEVTQIKGDSETHPLLSPEDEFANFESYRFLIDLRPDADNTATVTAGDYARAALLRGLKLGEKLGTNPYQFGMIGATDSHTGLASAEENNFHGKMALDSIPEAKAQPRIGSRGAGGWDMSASGLAAVWASENSREAIVAAFKRKEVYATSGPRIQLRFFAGWSFKPRDARESGLAKRGYSRGVPMGSVLPPSAKAKAPSFLVEAARDPIGANLDRIQIVKGWLDDQGKTHERVYNVAASEGRKIAANGSLAAVGNTVDLETAHYTNDIGDTRIASHWTDPDFDAEQSAFYYARVLQIPTPRHSLYDAIALQQEHPKDKAATIQERAYSSPIWYMPK